MSQRMATHEIHKPQQPLHNRQVIEIYTPHVQIPGVQHKRREEVKRLQTLYKDFALVSEKGRFIKVKNYKLNIDEWHMDGQVYLKPPFKDPDEVEQEFYKAVQETAGDKIFKNQQVTMQKNKEKRKKLEEEEIKLGYARPKKDYTGFSDDEDMEKTKKEQAKSADPKKQTLKRQQKNQEEEEKEIDQAEYAPDEEEAENEPEEDNQEEENAENEEDAEEPEEQEQEEKQEEPEQQEQEQEDAPEGQEEPPQEDEPENEEADEEEQPEISQISKKSLNASQKSVAKSYKSVPKSVQKSLQKSQVSQQVEEDDEEGGEGEEDEDVDELMELSKSMRSNKTKGSQGQFRSKTANMMDEMLSDLNLEEPKKKKR